MRTILSISLLALTLSTPPSAADDAKKDAKKPATKPAASVPASATGGLQTDEAKTLYALGLFLSRNLAPLGLSPADLAIVEDGMRDGVLGAPPKVEIETWGPKIQDLAKSRMGTAAGAEKKAGTAFVDKAAAEPGAVKAPSGFIYRELKPGAGESPKPTDRVKVHYTGTLRDGTVFDSSVTRGEPAVFGLNQVIPCWTQGVAMMKVGGKARLVCPAELAYGDAGSPPKIKGGATLVFEVELLGIEKPESSPAPK